MIRKIIAGGALVLVVVGAAMAGDMTGSKDDMMKAMQAEMMNCMIGKNMVPHMAELMPVMTMELVTLNDGMAVIHGVTDPSKVELLHSCGAKMAEAGEASMELSDDEAKTQLCGPCQGMRTLMVDGAKMSVGDTENGDIMVFTSEDPAVQSKIWAYEQEMRQMMAMHEESMQEG